MTVTLLLAAPGASVKSEQPDRVIVEWSGSASAPARRSARREAGVEFSGGLGNRRFELVEAEPGQTAQEAARELKAAPAVIRAEPDGYYSLDSIPNDPLFGQLWGLRNGGLGIDGFSGAVAGDDIDASGAWDRTVGTPGTVVADIDSGYRFEAPDLAGVAWTNVGETPENGLDDDGDGIVDDVHGADFVGTNAETPAIDGDPTDDDLISGGHGVHTAGTIGAQGNNGTGITGVAQDISIMPLRVCSRRAGQQDESCPTSALIEAINYAGAHGARVANMSLGGEFDQPAMRDAIAANPQTLFVIAAGNDGEDNEVKPHYPCVYDPLAEGQGPVDNMICVAATDQADQLAEFSNWGANTVDLGAPGTEILSTYPITRLFGDEFEVDDFASKWIASGPDGGLARTNEAPLTSYGMSDSPGALPVADSIRASTSVPVTIPAGFQNCSVELTRASFRGTSFFEVLLEGEDEFGASIGGVGRISHNLGADLSGGGELAVRISYRASANPASQDGLWVDNVGLHCLSRVGEPGGYAFLQGTSMATPHVTGAAACSSP